MAKAIAKSPKKKASFKWGREDYSFTPVPGKTIVQSRKYNNEQKYLLTKAGECELFSKIENLRSKFKKLTSNQDFTSADIKLIRESGRKNSQETKRKAGQLSFLYDEASSYNQGLIGSVAKHYIGYGIDFADLVSAGQLGLLTAIDRFDLKRRTRFSTCATWWIRNAIQQEIRNNQSTIRVPAKVLEHRAKVNNARQALAIQGDFSPSVKKIAKTAKITEENVENVLNLKWVNNLVEDYEEDSRGNFAQFSDPVQDQTFDGGPEQVMIADTMDLLNKVINKFDTRTRFVLDHVFGLNGKNPKTIKGIVSLFRSGEMSKNTVINIKERALEKIRQNKEIMSLAEIDPDILSKSLLALSQQKNSYQEDPDYPETYAMYMLGHTIAPELSIAG